MASLPPDASNQRTGFVTLPIWILDHPGLTDCDLRIVLVLDLIGWREGDMDGIVWASNKEIGERAGKKTTAVRESLRRLRSIEPPIIEREMTNPNARQYIRLAYDRFGGVSGDPATPQRKSAYPTPKGKRESGHQVSVKTPTHHIDSNGIVLVPVPDGVVGGIPATLPLSLAELMAWFPNIAKSPEQLDEFNRLGPLWFDWISRRCPQHSAAAAEWIEDAINDAISAKAENIVTYARKILKIWVGGGGRPDFELATPRVKAMPDETDTVAPDKPYDYSRRTAAPARDDLAARKAQLSDLFPNREAADGPR